MPPSQRPILLVVDDEPAIVALIERFAGERGFDVIARADGRAAIAELHHIAADVALVDLRMPEIGGLDVLRAIRAADPGCQVILMTGQGTIDSAIEAVKLGALDYLGKPFDFDRLGELLGAVRGSLERRREMLRADGDQASQFEFCGLIGRTAAMQELFDTVRRLAPHVRTALVTGETGTGKELMAHALHASGRRARERFLSLNCSAIVESLFESELFGHVRGAFTGAIDANEGLFEAADRGTLFLDEIGELAPPMQAKLLRVVEQGEVKRVGATTSRRVDVCIVAATNRDLRQEVSAGRFRQDLFYRLNVIEIRIPPLRERREDIPYLTAVFVRHFAQTFKKSISGLSIGAEGALQNAPWPGNIRELRNVIERACLLTDGSLITERDVRRALGSPAVATPRPVAHGVVRRPSPEPDRQQVNQMLQELGGNKAATARALGIDRRALYRILDGPDCE
jgi:two-component system response regulator HydG